MKNINPKVEFLLREGFSILTLERFDNNQINLLYEKTKKEFKEQPAPKVTNKTVKQIELAPGSKTTVTGDNAVTNDGGKTIITQTTEGEVTEKALSKKQQQFFGIVRGMQKGDTPKKDRAGEAAKEMKKKDVKDFASTKHKGLPNKVKKDKDEDVKKLEESILRLVEKHLNPETTKADLLKMLKRK